MSSIYFWRLPPPPSRDRRVRVSCAWYWVCKDWKNTQWIYWVPSENLGTLIFGVQGVRKSIIFVPLSCRRQPIWCPLSITLILFCVPFTVAHRTHWLSWNLNIPCVTFFRQILYRGVTECLPFLSYLTILAELLCMIVISKYAFKMCNKNHFRILQLPPYISFSCPTTCAHSTQWKYLYRKFYCANILSN